MIVLISFWRSLTKKDNVKSARYEIYKKNSTLTPILGRFFHGSGSRSGFFRIGSGFLPDPDPDSEKKSDPDPEKNPDPKHWLNQCCGNKYIEFGSGSRVTMLLILRKQI